jgi:hypothetical protein
MDTAGDLLWPLRFGYAAAKLVQQVEKLCFLSRLR